MQNKATETHLHSLVILTFSVLFWMHHMIKCTSLAIILQAYHIDLDIMQWLDVISNVEPTLFYTFTRFHIIALLITS